MPKYRAHPHPRIVTSTSRLTSHPRVVLSLSATSLIKPLLGSKIRADLPGPASVSHTIQDFAHGCTFECTQPSEQCGCLHTPALKEFNSLLHHI